MWNSSQTSTVDPYNSHYMEEIEDDLHDELDALLGGEYQESQVKSLCNYLLQITKKHSSDLIDLYYAKNYSKESKHPANNNKNKIQKPKINIFIQCNPQPAQPTQPIFPQTPAIYNTSFLPSQYSQPQLLGPSLPNYPTTSPQKSKKTKSHDKKSKHTKKSHKKKSKSSKKSKKKDTKQKVIQIDESQGGILQYFDQKATENNDQSTIQISCELGNHMTKRYRNLHRLNRINEQFQSKQRSKSDRFIIFDFIDNKIEISSYTIKSSTYDVNCTHLKNWSIDVSDDKSNWQTIDEHSNCSDLNGPSILKTFNVMSKKFARYVRLMNRGEFYGQDHWALEINFVEFYGKIKVPKV